MAEILHHLVCKNTTNNGRSYLSTGAGFQPSTVSSPTGSGGPTVEEVPRKQGEEVTVLGSTNGKFVVWDSSGTPK